MIIVDRTIFWNDSENVWYWVRNQSRGFKPFFANRIGEIQWSTSPEQWQHVSGMVNRAADKGAFCYGLAESEVWMEGPTFKDDESTWPAAPLPGDDTKKTEHCERRTTTKTHMTRSHASVIIDQTNSQASSVWFMWQDGLSDSWPIVDFQRIYEQKIESSYLPRYRKQRPSGLSKPKPSRVEKTKGRWLGWTLRMTEILRMGGRLRYTDELPYGTRHPPAKGPPCNETSHRWRPWQTRPWGWRWASSDRVTKL